jgi:hypothetical protein
VSPEPGEVLTPSHPSYTFPLFTSSATRSFTSSDIKLSENVLSTRKITGCWYISLQFRAFQISLYAERKSDGATTIGNVSPKLAFRAKCRSD